MPWTSKFRSSRSGASSRRSACLALGRDHFDARRIDDAPVRSRFAVRRVGDVTPQSLLRSTDAQLKKDGFSRQKTSYARHLAEAVIAQHIDFRVELSKFPPQVPHFHAHEIVDQCVGVAAAGQPVERAAIPDRSVVAHAGGSVRVSR